MPRSSNVGRVLERISEPKPDKPTLHVSSAEKIIDAHTPSTKVMAARQNVASDAPTAP